MIPGTRPPLKILITGTFSSGKTTLAEGVTDRLCRAGYSASLVPEAARRCPFGLNRHQSIGVSTWLLGEQIRAESEALLSAPDVVVCDSGVFDVLAHSISQERYEPLLTNEGIAVVELTRAWKTTYGAVFWTTVDASRPIEHDGVRLPDKRYQKEIEDCLARAFATLQVRPIRLAEMLEQRIEAVYTHSVRLLQRTQKSVNGNKQ